MMVFQKHTKEDVKFLEVINHGDGIYAIEITTQIGVKDLIFLALIY